MKKLILLLLLSLFILNCSSDDDSPNPNVDQEEMDDDNDTGNDDMGDDDMPTEKIFEGLAILETQAEVDAFGAENYTIINGDLIIGLEFDLITFDSQPETNITDISALSSIITVTGAIHIGNNSLLTSLNGLENLTSTSGLLIGGNDLLTSLDDLKSLTTITGEEIAFGELRFTGGAIFLELNPALISLTALRNLSPQSISNLSIIENESLVSLEGLESITSLMGNAGFGARALFIANNNSLSSLNGLNNIEAILNGVAIINNNLLPSLQGLVNLETLEGNSSFIRNNNNLADFCTLQTALQNNPSTETEISGNAFNPTVQDIIDGNCSQ